MVRRQDLLSIAGNATKPDADSLGPKSAITVAIALSLLLIGFGIAKLLDRCYRRARLLDDGSDVSEHTRHLLQLRKSSRRGLLSRRGCQLSEEERRQWQMTVLSMWQNRTADVDESCQDEHTLMLSRLRNAWLSRRRGHQVSAVSAAAAAAAAGRTHEQLQAEVRRVALAWLAHSREAAALADLRDRRRRSGHYAMMRRLSQAWRQHDPGQNPMRTIDESDGSGDDSFTTVDMPDWVDEGSAVGIRGEAASSEAAESAGSEEDNESAGSEAAEGLAERTEEESGGYCQLL